MIRRLSGLLPGQAVSDLEGLLLNNLDFPWYLQPGTAWVDKSAGGSGDWLMEWPDARQFCHNFVFDGAQNSNYLQEVLRLLDWSALPAKLGVPAGLCRLKANLMLNTPGPAHNPPHVDSFSAHTTVIYYINDSDGDTVFFDRRGGEAMDKSAKIVARETPKAGDFLVFDGDLFHASSLPARSGLRCVLNFNLVEV
jgi:hypothetical protein